MCKAPRKRCRGILGFLILELAIFGTMRENHVYASFFKPTNISGYINTV